MYVDLDELYRDKWLRFV